MNIPSVVHLSTKIKIKHHNNNLQIPLAAVRNNGFWYKEYQIILWSLATITNKGNTEHQQMKREHIMTYTMHDNGMASAIQMDKPQFLISSDGSTVICSHQNKLIAIDQTTDRLLYFDK